LNPIKYPKTLHFPTSPGKHVNEIPSLENLVNTEIVITEKMDGANTLMNVDGVYSRSCEGFAYGSQFDWTKHLWETIRHLLIPGVDYFGETLFKEHKTHYINLPRYFMLFAVRSDGVAWASWSEVCDLAYRLGLCVVPTLFWDYVETEEELLRIVDFFGKEPGLYSEVKEGMVIRNSQQFDDKYFQYNVAKWVRAGYSKYTPVEKQERKPRQSCRYCDNMETMLVKGTGYLCSEHIGGV
jgi:hypothetical protein